MTEAMINFKCTELLPDAVVRNWTQVPRTGDLIILREFDFKFLRVVDIVWSGDPCYDYEMYASDAVKVFIFLKDVHDEVCKLNTELDKIENE